VLRIDNAKSGGRSDPVRGRWISRLVGRSIERARAGDPQLGGRAAGGSQTARRAVRVYPDRTDYRTERPWRKGTGSRVGHDEIVRGRIDFDAVGHYARRDIFSLQVNGRPMPAVRTRFAERQEIALDSERDTVKGVPPSRHGTDEAAPH